METRPQFPLVYNVERSLSYDPATGTVVPVGDSFMYGINRGIPDGTGPYGAGYGPGYGQGCSQFSLGMYGMGYMGDFWDDLKGAFETFAHYLAEYGHKIAPVLDMIPCVGPALSAGVLAASSACKIYEDIKRKEEIKGQKEAGEKVKERVSEVLGDLGGYGGSLKEKVEFELMCLAIINKNRKKKGLPFPKLDKKGAPEWTLKEAKAYIKKENEKVFEDSIKKIDKIVKSYMRKARPYIIEQMKEVFLDTDSMFTPTGNPYDTVFGKPRVLSTLWGEYGGMGFDKQPDMRKRIIDDRGKRVWKGLVRGLDIDALVNAALSNAEMVADYKTYTTTDNRGRRIKVVNEPSIKITLSIKDRDELDEIEDLIVRRYCKMRLGIGDNPNYLDWTTKDLMLATAEQTQPGEDFTDKWEYRKGPAEKIRTRKPTTRAGGGFFPGVFPTEEETERKKKRRRPKKRSTGPRIGIPIGRKKKESKRRSSGMRRIGIPPRKEKKKRTARSRPTIFF